MAHFHLTITKVGESLWEGEATSLTIMTTEGEVTILAHHEAYVAPVVPGMAKVIDEKQHTHEIKLSDAGVLEVSNNQATVIV